MSERVDDGESGGAPKKPKVPAALREAIRKARQEAEFAERIEWLKQQDFNPLAVRQQRQEVA